MIKYRHFSPRILLSISIGVIAIFAIIFYLMMNNLVEKSLALKPTNLTKQRLEDALAALNETENFQRGFLLSSDSVYLTARAQAINKLESKMVLLDSAIGEDKSQQHAYDVLKKAIGDRLRNLDIILQNISPRVFNAQLEHLAEHDFRLMKEVSHSATILKMLGEGAILKQDLELIKQKSKFRIVLIIFIAAAAFTLIFSLYELLLEHKKNIQLKESERSLEAQVEERSAQLKERNQFIESIIENSHELIAVYDKNCVLLMVNKATERLMGKKREELIGKSLIELFPNSKGSKSEMDLKKALNGAMIENEAFFSPLTKRYFQNYIAPLRDASGTVYAALAIGHDVTRLMKTENELKTSQHQFSVMFNVSSVAMSLSIADERTVLDVNKAWEKMFEKSRIDVIGKSEQHAGIGNATKAIQKFNTSNPMGHSVQGAEVEFRLASGKALHTYLSMETIELNGKTCYLIAYFDISELKKSKDIINTINHQLNEAQRLSHIGSWDWDVQQNKFSWTDELYRIYGVDQTVFNPTLENYLSASHPEDFDTLSEVIRHSYQTHLPFKIRHRIVRPDGIVRFLLAKGEVILNEANEVVRMVGTEQDISEAIKTEEEIKSQAQRVMLKNAELEKANKDLTSFTYIASHDLQEPLRKIQSFNKLILDSESDKLSERGKDYFMRSISASQRMQELINSLLRFSRACQSERVTENINLNVVLSDVLRELKETIDQKNALIEFDVLPVINAVPVQMNQLFLNLIGNALKYSRKNSSPRIKIKSERLNPDQSPLYTLTWKISVEDNGIGFEPQFAQKIFGLFQRLHGRSDYEGTGIGLAICQKIIENHKGFITASAQPDKGAIFTFFLPAQE